MKNVHLILTDKPSILFIDEDDTKLRLYKEPMVSVYATNQNIYITNSEEIKEGDWFLQTTYEGIFKCSDAELEYIYFNVDNYEPIAYCKKIILTTDPKLIKDGVQAIDDKFLEWICKNPSCEEVKIESWQTKGEWDLDYKIIIPKEEPKQTKCYCGHTTYCDCGPKQETLEEASKDYIENTMKFSFNSLETKTQANRMLKCVEFGAKWQQERSYSEEEVLELLKSFKKDIINSTELDDDFETLVCDIKTSKWFEQFKKK